MKSVMMLLCGVAALGMGAAVAAPPELPGPQAADQIDYLFDAAEGADRQCADGSRAVKSDAEKIVDAEQAAARFFERSDRYASPADAAKLRVHLNEYLRTWVKQGGIDRQIIAEIKLGELAWRESCPVDGSHGLCIKRADAPASQRYPRSAVRPLSAWPLAGARQERKDYLDGLSRHPCSPERHSRITLVERSASRVQEAMNHFSRASALYQDGRAKQLLPFTEPQRSDARVKALVHHVALARLAQADQAYERFLRLQVPSDIRFRLRVSLEDASRRNLQGGLYWRAWNDRKTGLLEQARTLYQQVLRLGDPHFTLAAQARSGQLFADFASQLSTAELPVPPPPPPGLDVAEYRVMVHDMYCDAFTDRSDALTKQAEEAFLGCLREGERLVWFNEWSRQCEEELYRIAPRKYPLAAEIRIEPPQ